MSVEPPVRAPLQKRLESKGRGKVIRLVAVLVTGNALYGNGTGTRGKVIRLVSALLGFAYWAGLLGAFLAVVVAIRLWPYLVEPDRLPGRLRSYFGLWSATTVAIVLVGGCVSLCRNGKKRFVFSHILFGFVVGVSGLVGWLALTVVVPPWPNRDLRPQPLLRTFPGFKEEEYNKWDMRDFPRQVNKPQGAYRIVFIGDSFLEGGFCKSPIPVRSDRLYRERLQDQSTECVNLGVCGTDPPHYYYRMKNVGAKLLPDAVFLFVFAGNDFVQPEDVLRPGKERLTKYVAEAPFPSVLGKLSPQINWLVVNHFQPGSSGSGTQPAPADELEILKQMTLLPFEEGTQKIADHMHRYHTPQYTPEQIVAVLRRGGPSFWAALQPREQDQEYLQAWLIADLLSWELGITKFPRTPSEVDPQYVGPSVAATFTWIEGIKSLCDDRGIPLVVFLAPVGTVDPTFVEFWKPWPSYSSFNYYQTARATALLSSLRAKGIQTVDLTETLAGVPNTYRKIDAHWNEKGHDLVTDVVVREMARLRTAR